MLKLYYNHYMIEFDWFHWYVTHIKECIKIFMSFGVFDSLSIIYLKPNLKWYYFLIWKISRTIILVHAYINRLTRKFPYSCAIFTISSYFNCRFKSICGFRYAIGLLATFLYHFAVLRISQLMVGIFINRCENWLNCLSTHFSHRFT